MPKDVVVELEADTDAMKGLTLPFAAPSISSPSARLPLPRQVAKGSGTIHMLEEKLRASVSARCTSGQPSAVLRKAFKAYDRDHNGSLDIVEFATAMQRFGLHTDFVRAGSGGVSRDVVQALFDKYDVDGSGFLSLDEFSKAFFQGR